MPTAQFDLPVRTPVPAPPKPARGELKFAACEGFYRTIRERVEQYFEETGLNQRDCPRMYAKTAFIFGWCAVSYVLLVFVAATWWQALPLAASLGLAMAGIGFNIQHDGGHQAYSKSKWVNRLMALSLDLLGGSSYVWARKHNSIHHSYTNVTGHDDDIDVGLLGRLSPHQPRLGIHRLQHLYLWVLYGFLPMKWQLFDDFRDVSLGRSGGHRMARPQGWDLAVFLGGKTLFLALAFGIPLIWHPLWQIVLCYVAATFVQGVVLSVVFQLAHCVEHAAFPLPEEETGRIEQAWAVHQVETTVDFACGNRLVTWYCGGLNFQIEHHLFPRICHIHYPALAPLVRATCLEFDVRYVTNKTLGSALKSHFLFLRQMGMAAAH